MKVDYRMIKELQMKEKRIMAGGEQKDDRQIMTCNRRIKDW